MDLEADTSTIRGCCPDIPQIQIRSGDHLHPPSQTPKTTQQRRQHTITNLLYLNKNLPLPYFPTLWWSHVIPFIPPTCGQIASSLDSPCGQAGRRARFIFPQFRTWSGITWAESQFVGSHARWPLWLVILAKRPLPLQTPSLRPSIAPPQMHAKRISTGVYFYRHVIIEEVEGDHRPQLISPIKTWIRRCLRFTTQTVVFYSYSIGAVRFSDDGKYCSCSFYDLTRGAAAPILWQTIYPVRASW
jgi:hypothetical protein